MGGLWGLLRGILAILDQKPSTRNRIREAIRRDAKIFSDNGRVGGFQCCKPRLNTVGS